MGAEAPLVRGPWPGNGPCPIQTGFQMVFDPIRSRVGRPLPLERRVFGRTSSGISSNGNRSKTMPCPKGLGGGNSYPRRSEGHRGLRWAGISIKKLRRKLFQDWTNRPADGRDARNFVCSPGPLGGSPANSGRHIVSVPSPARMRLNKRPCLTPPAPRPFPWHPSDISTGAPRHFDRPPECPHPPEGLSPGGAGRSEIGQEDAGDRPDPGLRHRFRGGGPPGSPRFGPPNGERMPDRAWR